mmetsp:Transcript_22408/g.57048  ORF Transcript_22408/g.57048 Transcript_22408/m.57048 type:complete len:638 (+) Transcript_22408:411-2324(+)
MDRASGPKEPNDHCHAPSPRRRDLRNSRHEEPDRDGNQRYSDRARLEPARSLARRAARCRAIPGHRPGRVARAALPLPHRVAHACGPASPCVAGAWVLHHHRQVREAADIGVEVRAADLGARGRGPDALLQAAGVQVVLPHYVVLVVAGVLSDEQRSVTLDRSHVVRVGNEARVAPVVGVTAIALFAADDRLHGCRNIGGVHRHLVHAAAPVVRKADVVASPCIIGVIRRTRAGLVLHAFLNRRHHDVALTAVHAVGEALHLVPLRGAAQVAGVATGLEARCKLLHSGLHLEALEPGTAVNSREACGANRRGACARRGRFLEDVGEGLRRGGRADLCFRGGPHANPLEREAPTVRGTGLRGLGAEELPCGEVICGARDKPAQVDVAAVVREVHHLPVWHHVRQLPRAAAHGHALLGEVAASGGGARPSLEGVAELVRLEVAVVRRLPSREVAAHRVRTVIPHPVLRVRCAAAEHVEVGGRPCLRIRLVLLSAEVRVPRGEGPGARDPHATVRAPVHVRGLLQLQCPVVRVLLKLEEVGRTWPVFQMHNHVGLPALMDHACEVRVVRNKLLARDGRPRAGVDGVNRNRVRALLHDDAEGVTFVRIRGAPSLARLHNDLVVLLVVDRSQDHLIENLHLL